MRAALKKTFRTSQFALLVLLAGTALLFGIVNPQILTLANLYALIRASLVPAVFALSIMLVMVQGGIDMSFGMIGAFSSYVVLFILTENGIFGQTVLSSCRWLWDWWAGCNSQTQSGSGSRCKAP